MKRRFDLHPIKHRQDPVGNIAGVSDMFRGTMVQARLGERAVYRHLIVGMST